MYGALTASYSFAPSTPYQAERSNGVRMTSKPTSLVLAWICSNSDCSATAGWGDAKALNLWTYYSAPFETNTLLVDPIVIDVATAVSAPASAVGITSANRSVRRRRRAATMSSSGWPER